MRPPLGPLAETNTTEKVHFAKDAWNNGYAVAGERRAADAVYDIRGFALRSAEEGNRDVDGSHDELSARNMR